MAETHVLFRDDAYLKEAEGKVVRITDRGGIVLDRTIFYATSGGQPGDTGFLDRADGTRLAIAGTITGESKEEILHIPAAGAALPQAGETLRLAIDWERRYRLMRMHTACHLLTVVCPFPITGAAVAEDDSRIDFDIPEAGFTKEDVTRALNELVAANHPVLVEECQAAGRHRPHPAGLHRRQRRGRQPALRRHARPGDSRGRRDPHRQDREEGAREPPLPHPLRPAAGAVDLGLVDKG
jgi:Ser-tRNA(Ala) deacylase AlaX